MRSRSIAPRVAVALAAFGLVWIAGEARAAAATVKRFTYTGAQQFFAVPDNVTNLHIVAVGGKGGNGSGNAGGGFGGVATGDVAVTPGQILLVSVGGNGGHGSAGQPGIGGVGGYNGGAPGGTSAFGWGGGGGGGLSDVRPAGGIFATFFLVAAGGGGSGGNVAGGAGGQAVQDGLNAGSGAPGGGGGGGAPGTGGLANGGGTGGSTGGFGVGGPGQPSVATPLVPTGAAGGGGAGMFGGGGGVAGSGSGSSGGGGGAGSSGYQVPPTENWSYARDTTGVPSVTITYEPPATPGAGGSPGGTSVPGGGGTIARPVLSALRLAPSAFVAARRGGPTGGTQGATVSYRASVAATTTFRVLAPRSGVRSSTGACLPRRRGRRGRSCTRYVSLGSFTRRDVAGFNTFVFTGRIRGHKLRRGSYKLEAVAKTDAGSSDAVRVGFRIAT
jgi:hypothetical protein